MEILRIAELLEPFAPGLPPALLEQVSAYLDLLLRWNSRTNLSAVRDSGQIVARHFGESLFAARALLGGDHDSTLGLADVGSGAGFPGIPLKLFAPRCKLTLIESQNKKATFLREVIRTLGLTEAEVFYGRAEQWDQTADLVTLRAVERFERALAVSEGLVVPGGRLALLIATNQLASVHAHTSGRFAWEEPHPIPDSGHRVLLVGKSTA
jgi:16S rRNA (guanine527-N7)-methyltransferase